MYVFRFVGPNTGMEQMLGNAVSSVSASSVARTSMDVVQ